MFSVWRTRPGSAPSPDTGGAEGPSLAAPQLPGEVPRGFEAIAEAVVADEGAVDACEALGRELALDGASADEALQGLRDTWQLLRGSDPPFDAVAAVVKAWSDATLAVVNHISCEDPMTGLASTAHLRSSLEALFRGQRRAGVHPRDSHALVVVELAGERREGAVGGDPIVRAMRMTSLGEAARTVFPAGEVVGRVAAYRVAVLVQRDAKLGVRVRLLRRLVEGMESFEHAPRVWIEGLPATDLSAGILLDELARS